MPRLTLFKKILAITLSLSLLPLLLSSFILLSNLERVSRRITSVISDTSDRQAAESLQMRARHVAETVADLLGQCENDLLFLARSRPDAQALRNFYLTRRGEVWQRAGTRQAPYSTREFIPLYRSIALIDRNGRERMVIRDGRTLAPAELRTISNPAETEFLSEEYFRHTRKLEPGQIHVTHLTGFHLSRQRQLAGADEPEDAYGGELYRGVVRFSTPLRDGNGDFDGIIVISLDHRHLMEMTQHIDPGKGFLTLFPSYKSGNYAFMFDDEGWIITHPKYWDIRGVDDNGRPVPPYTAASTPADRESGRIPFNLDHAGFIHQNYPRVARDIRNRLPGTVDITNVGGAKKIMAYAPILYSTGPYGKYGVFGGITIGFQVDQFHDAARQGSRLINRELREHLLLSALIIFGTALLAAFSALRLSRGIGSQLQRLTEGARLLAAGSSGTRVPVQTNDEIGELASTFNSMADELEQRKSSLLATLDELRRSRLEILDERNFKESILESISSAIVTFSPDGLLTSINATGRYFLGSRVCIDMTYHQAFEGWGDMAERTGRILTEKYGYGRQPLHIDRPDGKAFFDIGFFPIGKEAEKGLTVTMRNETEKEKLREEMVRLDRFASLGKLSAGIAHEVRNPLTGISLLLDDLHDRAESGSSDRTMIKKALEEIERVERLINALLNYSAPARVEFRQADLNQLIRDMVLLMGRQCERQKVRISVAAGDVPSFCFDPEKIKQALLNITRNALEAMPGEGEITIESAAVEGHAVITVSDTGHGIRGEDLPLLFEPFFTRKGAGTGLGLSITQRIIEEHHGTIRADSLPGRGAVFIIRLPMAHRDCDRRPDIQGGQ